MTALVDSCICEREKQCKWEEEEDDRKEEYNEKRERKKKTANWLGDGWVVGGVKRK